MTLSQQDKALADAKIASKLASLIAVQNSHYLQKVGTDQDGIAILRKKYLKTPAVQDGDLTYEMHEYDGTQGQGYILHAWMTVNGVKYHSQQDFGQEGRSRTWELTP